MAYLQGRAQKKPTIDPYVPELTQMAQIYQIDQLDTQIYTDNMTVQDLYDGPRWHMSIAISSIEILYCIGSCLSTKKIKIFVFYINPYVTNKI